MTDKALKSLKLALSSGILAASLCFLYARIAKCDWNVGEEPRIVNAALAGDTEGLLALIDAGEPVDTMGSRNWTALHFAAGAGQTQMLAELLKRGANPNARATDGMTPLHIAAFSGRPEALWTLAKAGAELDARDNAGRTPLMLASFEGDVRSAGRLIAAGADVNARNASGSTALDFAAIEGFLPVVEALLEAKADPDGMKLGSSGADSSDSESAKGDISTPMMAAAMAGSPEVIRALARRGASVDVQGRYLYTPLHLAAKLSHEKAVLALLELGADPSKLDSKGLTPSGLAKAPAIKQALLEAQGKAP